MASVHPELIGSLAERMRGARGRQERGRLAREAAARWGVDVSTVRRWLREQGVTRGPRTSTAAERCSIPEADVVAVAGLLSENKRKKLRGSVKQALEIARANDLISAEAQQYSLSTWHRALSAHRLNRFHREAATPTVSLRSLHPNHVHLTDFSPCPQWDLTGKGPMRDLPAHLVPYKPEQLARQRLHLWRYGIVDHFSGAFYVRYYLAAGENKEDFCDFLWRAWRPKEHRGYPFSGVPQMLISDQGAPLKARTTRSLLAELGCELSLHTAGRPWAKGAIEQWHSMWESEFDARLRLNPARTLEELNERAEAAAIKLQLERPHRRHGLPRSVMYRRHLRDEHLRTVNCSWERWRLVATGKEEQRTVDNTLRIQWGGQKWALNGPVSAGERVLVVESLDPEAPIRVWTSRDEELTVELTGVDAAGFPLGRRSVVIGNNERASHPETPSARLKRTLEELSVSGARPEIDAFGDPLAELGNVEVMPLPAGRPAIAADRLPTAPPVSPEDVAYQALGELGRRLTREESTWIDQQVGHGIPRDQVASLIAQLRAGTQPPRPSQAAHDNDGDGARRTA